MPSHAGNDESLVEFHQRERLGLRTMRSSTHNKLTQVRVWMEGDRQRYEDKKRSSLNSIVLAGLRLASLHGVCPTTKSSCAKDTRGRKKHKGLEGQKR